jgi:pimeloyl-ACP methyl ester carboxylesterase
LVSNPLNIKKYGNSEIKLVAIHGLGSASSAWDLVRNQFAANYQFITLDLPGHGDASMRANKNMNPVLLADIVKEELAKFGIDEFHLIGNSLGGWVALEIAAKYPESVLSLTGIAPAGLWLVPKTHRNGELAISRYMAKATYKIAYPIARLKFMRSIGFKLVSPQWEKFSIETCAKAAIAMGSATGYFDLWDAFLGNRFDKEISKDIPITIIFGDTDNTLPESNCQERSLAPSHANWLIFPASGHAPMWDQAEMVIEATEKTIYSYK